MQIIKGKEKIGNILFIIGISLELLVMLTGHCSWITLPYSGRIVQAAFILFGCKVLFTRYEKRDLIVIFILGILGVISYLTLHDEYVIRAVMLIAAAKDIDDNRIVKIIFYSSLAATIFIVVMALLGIRGQIMDVRDYGRGGVEARWCMGFNHANNVHCMYWYLTVLFLYMKKNACKIWWYIVILAGDVGLYILTASKTGLIATALVVIAMAVCDKCPVIKQKKWPYIAGVASVVACIAMTILGAAYGNANAVSRFLDKFLNQRLNMCHDIAYIGDWKLFPGAREMEKIVDNGMGNFVYTYGIVMALVMIGAIVYLIIGAYKERNALLLVIVVTYTYVWFMESSFAINTSLLCTIMYIMLFNRWNKQSELILQEK